MEFRNFYIVIFLIGLVFSILSLTSNFGTDTAITILFLTIAFILVIQLLAEFRYYRSYNAPLAAGIFLLIPSALAIGGSYVSRHPALSGQPFLADKLFFIVLHISFSADQQLLIYVNTFSIIFGIFYVILIILFYRYYFGIYPRLFLMRKKFYKQFAMYYNIVLMAIIGLIWISTNSIEIFELAFVVTSIILIIRTYIFKIALVPVRAVPTRNRRPTPRRSYTSPTFNQSNSSTTTNNRVSQPVRTQTTIPSRITAPVRNTPPVQTQVRPVRNSTPSMASIDVVEGIPVNPSAKTSNVSKLNINNLKDMIPIAQHLTQDDFRCIFCYELPLKSTDQVVICPNCKKPAHYPEYQKWTSFSNFCSYCNQDIGNRTPKRVSGKNYKNIIAVALKK